MTITVKIVIKGRKHKAVFLKPLTQNGSNDRQLMGSKKIETSRGGGGSVEVQGGGGLRTGAAPSWLDAARKVGGRIELMQADGE